MDSCHDFFGDNHEESGLLDTAREEVDGFVNVLKYKRFKKLKEYIRNKVPYQYRNLDLLQIPN